MKKIVLVEDDERLANLVQSFLQQHSFDVTVLHSGEQATQTILRLNPDVVILDVMLPGLDGFSICREIKNQFHNPILFLTAKDSPIDHVMGLEIGADDYIIKPIDPHVLLARINLVLRRNSERVENHSCLTFGQLKIDKSARSVSLSGQLVELTSHEFELLWLLADVAGEPKSRNDIHQAMIGREYDGLDRTVDVRISRLRKKLNDDTEHPYRIVTVWGKGYMLCPNSWE